MYKKIRLLVIILICYVSAKAQTENSPYSRYGLGDIVPQQTILSRGMGGISAAYYDIQSINFLNPASYSRLKFTTLDLGFQIDNRTLRAADPPRKFSSTSPTISYVQLGIPFFRTKKNWGMNIGLRPVTRINYKIEKRERLAGIDSVLTLFEGDGGAYEVFGGTGFAIKNFSLGINVGYLFGSKDYSTRRSFIADSSDMFYYQSNHETKSYYGGAFLNAGFQYTIKFSKMTALHLGAYGNIKHELNASKDIIRETFSYVQDATVRIDSVFEQKNILGNVKYPASYGMGLVLTRSDKWLVGADFSTTKWSDYRFFDETDLVQDSWKFHVGGQIIPNAVNPRSYWNRVAYRAGFVYGRDYIKVDHDLPVWTFSLGAGLPMRKAAYSNQYTLIHTAFEFGQRGNNDNLLRENFFRVSVGLSLSDIWFLKRQYD